MANSEVSKLAYEGKWNDLLKHLRANPDLVNLSSESSGYTPLHQAAWHGASLEVIGELLRIGADRTAKSHSKQQAPLEIAIEKHPRRMDLAFILTPQQLTISQALRQTFFELRESFNHYDGNQVLADRLVECFGFERCPRDPGQLLNRFECAFIALTGHSLSERGSKFAVNDWPSFTMSADTQFFCDQVIPRLQRIARNTNTTFLQREWTVIADLFEPLPSRWGARGDLFLWIEMRQALCHVQLPRLVRDVSSTIAAAFEALTGSPLSESTTVPVSRFRRGGISGGMVSGDFWRNEFTQLIQQRLDWLQTAWGPTSRQF